MSRHRAPAQPDAVREPAGHRRQRTGTGPHRIAATAVLPVVGGRRREEAMLPAQPLRHSQPQRRSEAPRPGGEAERRTDSARRSETPRRTDSPRRAEPVRRAEPPQRRSQPVAPVEDAAQVHVSASSAWERLLRDAGHGEVRLRRALAMPAVALVAVGSLWAVSGSTSRWAIGVANMDMVVLLFLVLRGATAGVVGRLMYRLGYRDGRATVFEGLDDAYDRGLSFSAWRSAERELDAELTLTGRPRRGRRRA